MSIKERLQRVRERIAVAAERAGRDPSDITIVGVTKTHPASLVTEAIRAGVEDVGENRIQEFLSKADDVALECRWHLVGHLQTNKVNKAIGRFALIHSVDSLRLASKLSAAGVMEGIVTSILIEVNTSGEESKFGLSADAAPAVCERIAQLPGVRIKGLMTVGPWVDDKRRIAGAFAGLRRLGEEIAAFEYPGVSIEHLSMGMSDDYEIAVAEGATILRLGRVLFGERGSVTKN